MNSRITTTIFLSLILAVQFVACGPDNPPTKTDDGNNGNNQGPDTTLMFSDHSWKIDKVYKNGVHDPESFLSVWGCSYSIFDDGGYLFNVPAHNSASGTWEFGEHKKTVKLENQGAGSVWTILSIGDGKLVVEDRNNGSTDVLKYEMTEQ